MPFLFPVTEIDTSPVLIVPKVMAAQCKVEGIAYGEVVDRTPYEILPMEVCKSHRLSP